MVLCCPLQVNWLRSSVVNVGFAEIMNSGLDGVSLDALHAIWIWRAQLERVGGGSSDGSAGDAKGPKEELSWKLSA